MLKIIPTNILKQNKHCTYIKPLQRWINFETIKSTTFGASIYLNLVRISRTYRRVQAWADSRPET